MNQMILNSWQEILTLSMINEMRIMMSEMKLSIIQF